MKRLLISDMEYDCRAFLHEWRFAGGAIGVSRDGRVWAKPKRAITPQIRQFVRRHKEVIKSLLHLEQAMKEVSFEPDGYVYVLKAGPHYKIGRTTEVDRRIKQLSIQLPFEANLVHTIRCEEHDKSERYWHERFGMHRSNGEWFVLGEEQLQEITECSAMRGQEVLW